MADDDYCNSSRIVCGMNMKQESIPDVNMPYLTISTTYPGATPSQVADEVTKPVEQAVQNLTGSVL